MLTTTIHLVFSTYNRNSVDWQETEFLIQTPTSEVTGRSRNFLLQVSRHVASTHAAGCLEFKPSLAGVNADIRYGGRGGQTVKQIGCRQQIGIRHENLEGKSSLQVLNVHNYSKQTAVRFCQNSPKMKRESETTSQSVSTSTSAAFFF